MQSSSSFLSRITSPRWQSRVHGEPGRTFLSPKTAFPPQAIMPNHILWILLGVISPHSGVDFSVFRALRGLSGIGNHMLCTPAGSVAKGKYVLTKMYDLTGEMLKC